MKVALSIILLVVYCSVFCTATPDSLIVQTSFGEVKGLWNRKEHARVFKGIPYADSVSGDLRWTDPKFPPSWNGLLDATKNPPSCPQNCDYETDSSKVLCPNPTVNPQNEDCLILNVYTPENANENSKLPVFVFIHGGAYILGYSNSPLYDGSYLANQFNIIVVTMNYRLGALGFLVFKDSKFFGDDEIRGNFGIKDQRLALKWVQKEIANFGGDPGKVTLGGESAGAMSVAIHMTSKLSEGLFHQAIIESDPFGIEYKTVQQERDHGHYFAHSDFGFKRCATLTCLREKNVDEVLKAQSKRNILHKLFTESPEPWSQPVSWKPNIDPNGDELTDQPVTLFSLGKFNQVPTIMGTMTDEGTLFIYGLYNKLKLPLWLPTLLYNRILHIFFGSDFPTVSQLYPPGDNLSQLSKVFGDYGFTCPTLYSASHASNDVPVYSYVFDYHLKKFESLPACNDKNCHGKELPFVWHTLEDLYSIEDFEFADIISSYWGNFINNGDPNKASGLGASSQNLPSWPLFKTGSHGVSLNMAPDNMQPDDGYRLKYCKELDSIGYGKYDLFEGIVGLFEPGLLMASDLKDEL